MVKSIANYCQCFINMYHAKLEVLVPLMLYADNLEPFIDPQVRTQLHVTTSLSTGGGPVSCVQSSEGGFQVVYPLGLWSR